MNLLILVVTLFFANNCLAGVFKCTDAGGRTFYQSSPCSDQGKNVQINPKTGSSVDLTAIKQQHESNLEQRRQEEEKLKAEEEKKRQDLLDLKKKTMEEQELTKALMKQNSLQFSAFAIPAYNPDALSTQIKPFISRLPDVEKFRRLAAQKALATGQCTRVEAVDLAAKSQLNSLFFQVNCSSAANFNYNEIELTQ